MTIAEIDPEVVTDAKVVIDLRDGREPSIATYEDDVFALSPDMRIGADEPPTAWPGHWGEHPGVLERLIVAPANGTFVPHPPETVTTEGEIVYRGQVIGTVTSSGDAHAVQSNFTGFLMGVLAAPSQRVREGQPVAWLRATDGT